MSTGQEVCQRAEGRDLLGLQLQGHSSLPDYTAALLMSSPRARRLCCWCWCRRTGQHPPPPARPCRGARRMGSAGGGCRCRSRRRAAAATNAAGTAQPCRGFGWAAAGATLASRSGKPMQRVPCLWTKPAHASCSASPHDSLLPPTRRRPRRPPATRPTCPPQLKNAGPFSHSCSSENQSIAPGPQADAPAHSPATQFQHAFGAGVDCESVQQVGDGRHLRRL